MDRERNASEDSDVERMDGCRVLGKVEVTDAAQRHALATLIQQAVTEPTDGIMVACNWPRHAIVAHEGGKRFEIIICFQCENYSLNGGTLKTVRGTQPKAMLNQLLTEAKIPLAKE